MADDSPIVRALRSGRRADELKREMAAIVELDAIYQATRKALARCSERLNSIVEDVTGDRDTWTGTEGWEHYVDEQE